MFLLLRWIITAAALLLVAYLVPGIEVVSFFAALLGALVLGLINAVIRPLLYVLTLPINILTLGLFSFVLNALMLWFASSIVGGFSVSGIVPAFMGAVILWVVAIFTNHLIKAAKNS